MKEMISFTPFAPAHIPLLSRWLMAPHVHPWWNPEIEWTPGRVEERYLPRCSPESRIKAYVILLNGRPIGYIQHYDCHKVTRQDKPANLPESLAAFDMLIGEKEHTGRGIGSQALKLFLEIYSDPHYEYTFVDPDSKNIAAVRAYEKAGFKWQDTYMLRKR